MFVDLWMMLYEVLCYDLCDNVCLVDLQWVKELIVLMMYNGYDKGFLLYCYVCKVDGKDYFYVFKGQYCYFVVGVVIKVGKDFGRILIVVLDFCEVKWLKMVIDGYLSNVLKVFMLFDFVMLIVELCDVYKMDVKVICGYLNILE